MNDESHPLQADVSRWAHGFMSEAPPLRGHAYDLEIGAHVPGLSL